MDNLRLKKRKLFRGKRDIDIQLTDWNAANIEIDDEMTFSIKAFGVTKKGSSVSLNIYGFEPHFFINVPNSFTDTKCRILVEKVMSKMPALSRGLISSFKLVKLVKFWGFTNNEKCKFIKIFFKTSTAMNQAVRALKDEIRVSDEKKRVYEVFESNIPPLLRFFHIQDIEPSNWITLSKGKYTINNEGTFNTQLSFDVFYKNVKAPTEPILSIAPLLIASFDIECDSSHGDFPLPIKNYLKLSQEIGEIYFKENLSHLHYKELIGKMKELIHDAFHQDKKIVSNLYTKSNVMPKDATIRFAAKRCANVLKIQENYKMLVADIISNYSHTDKDSKAIKSMIEDAFCEDENYKEKSNIMKVYTKSQLKPTSSQVNAAAIKIDALFKRLYEPESAEQYDQYSKYYFLTKDEAGDHDISRVTFLANQIMTVFNDFPEMTVNKEIKVKRLNSVLSHFLPDLEGDKVIQIGTAVQKFGEDGIFIKHIITLGSCDPIEGTVVESYETESEVLLAWTEFIKNLDPDMITGFNTLGFDYQFMYDRAKELGIEEEFSMMSRIKDEVSEFKVQQLSSSALGDNTLSYLNMTGRVNMDLLKVVQRDYNLDSYKLDFVSEWFMNDKVISMNGDTLEIKNSKVLFVGNYLTFSKGEDKINEGQKYKILEIDGNNVRIDTALGEPPDKWFMAKDDVSPQDIFRLQNENSAGRATIATYCVQDCVLVLHLIKKLMIITNNIAMANTCSVPLSFIFLRGQGIKVFSLVSKECRDAGMVIPVIKYEQDTKTVYNKKFDYSLDYHEKPDLPDSYEGAIVLKPKPGLYLDKYVTVLDYSSLYPSSMISENISHDSICLSDEWLGEEGAERLKKLGYEYVDQPHDIYKWKDPKVRNKGKYKCGEKVCRFVQFPDGKKGIIPTILQKLLRKRKETRAKIKTETDEFKKAVLDGQQLSFKLTANSCYGAIGATTNPICMKDMAASTTSVGRSLLYLAQEKTLEKFPGSEIVYGDTDSIFINFNPKDADGNTLTGKEGLQKSIDLGIAAEKHIQQFLKKPHKLEYEKTFYPFILFSKKRYIGYKYEEDVNKYKETSMGVALKRRDNAKIVKHIYKNVLDALLKDQDIKKAVSVLNRDLQSLIDGKFPLNMLTITKSLRGFYANPESIAHKVLADRMGERDPGNKPKSNDRIPFVYIQVKEVRGQKMLQGDRVEHPTFIRENNLKPDYNFYITNQILKPVGQPFTLIVESLPGFNKGQNYYDLRLKHYLDKNGGDMEKANGKIMDEKLKDVEKLVFGEALRKAMNIKTQTREITDFFRRS